jgi:hypothetical protein
VAEQGNPVTSVAPFTSNSRIASAACLPGVSMVSSDPAATSALALANFIPAEITPVPIGLVRMITFPPRAGVVAILRGSIKPVTE